MPRISDEVWLETMLKRAHIYTTAFDGLTTPEVRRDIFRKVIHENQVADKMATRTDTFAQLFHAVYQEPV